MLSIGIDLAGNENNPTGLGLLTNKSITAKTLHSDNEILEFCKDMNPDIIAIDAPLAFPEGGRFRRADQELIERGHQVLPLTLDGMEKLTERGMKVSEKLRNSDFEIIEVHPKTSGKIITGTKSRAEWISKLKEEGWGIESNLSKHEVDSILAALTGKLYLEKRTEQVGGRKGKIVIPQKGSKVL